MFKKAVVIIISIVSIRALSYAQQPLRFGSGFFFGLDLAQIDGDDMQGFDKKGINFGLRGMAYVLPKLEVHAELAYSQRGSRSKEFNISQHLGRRLTTDYASTSLLLAINDWFEPIKEFYRLQLIGGVSLGRIVRYDTYDAFVFDNRKVNFTELTPYYNLTDFSMVLGANIKLTQKIGLSFRYNRSFNNLLDGDTVSKESIFKGKSVLNMKGYFLALDAFYLF